MNTYRNVLSGWLTRAPLSMLLLLTACATTSPRHARATKPAACSDSVYVQLAHQHPDSMSERAWQRFQSLDSACVRARSQAPAESHAGGMMGMGHGQNGAWAILAPLVVLGMAVMMVALRL